MGGEGAAGVPAVRPPRGPLRLQRLGGCAWSTCSSSWAAWACFKTRYRAEFLQALEAHPPQLIILSDHIDNPLYRATVPGQMRDFPALRDYIERGYTPDVQTPHYFVFRGGKPAGAPPSPSPSREAAGTDGEG